MRRLSFFDPSPWRRLQLGAVLALCGVGAALLDTLRLLVRERLGGEVVAPDALWAGAAALAMAFAVSSFGAALAGPLWRRRWPAGAVAAVCLWPPALLACGEHRLAPADAGAWIRSAVLAFGCGAWVVWRYPRLAVEMREHYVFERAARLARIRRRAAG